MANETAAGVRWEDKGPDTFTLNAHSSDRFDLCAFVQKQTYSDGWYWLIDLASHAKYHLRG
jgi:hypothetical protein